MGLFRFFDLGFRVPAATPPSTVTEGERSEPPFGAVPEDEEPTGDREPAPTTQLYDVDLKTTVLLYLGVVAGVLGKRVLDQIAAAGDFKMSWQTLLVSLILSAVGFAQIFRNRLVNINGRAIQLFVAFESGFFIDSVIRTIAAATERAG